MRFHGKRSGKKFKQRDGHIVEQYITERRKFLDHRNCNGYTALMMAAKLGHKEVVGLLIRDGAKKWISNGPLNAMKIAWIHGNIDVAEMFLTDGNMLSSF